MTQLIDKNASEVQSLEYSIGNYEFNQSMGYFPDAPVFIHIVGKIFIQVLLFEMFI